jgi:hypothetical protein
MERRDEPREATMRLKTLKTISAVRAAALSAGAEVFVRWSRGPAADAKMGWISKNHANGRYEAGLSVNPLDLDSDYELLSFIAEYEFLGHPVCYLVAGERVGRGSDGEPVIANCRPVARIHASLVWTKEQLELLRLREAVAFEEGAAAKFAASGCATTIWCAARRLATARAQVAALEAGEPWDVVRKIDIRG